VSAAAVDLTCVCGTLQDHWGLYNEMDIMLDSWPYCGTITSVECLMMGVPIVTLQVFPFWAGVLLKLWHACFFPFYVLFLNIICNASIRHQSSDPMCMAQSAGKDGCHAQNVTASILTQVYSEWCTRRFLFAHVFVFLFACLSVHLPVCLSLVCLSLLPLPFPSAHLPRLPSLIQRFHLNGLPGRTQRPDRKQRGRVRANSNRPRKESGACGAAQDHPPRQMHGYRLVRARGRENTI
jgi:hypothetical protein